MVCDHLSGLGPSEYSHLEGTLLATSNVPVNGAHSHFQYENGAMGVNTHFLLCGNGDRQKQKNTLAAGSQTSQQILAFPSILTAEPC